MASSSSANKPRVLFELGDATITTAECEILASHNSWLNDMVIAFYIEWCKQRSARTSFVVLIQPSAGFMLRLVPPEDLTASIPPGGNPFVDALSPKVDLICVPVNNASDASTGGGSHWSLLLFHKTRRIAEHIDSSRGLNQIVAIETAGCLATLLGISDYKFKEVESYQQQNSHDCGIIVLLHLNNIMFPEQAVEVNGHNAIDFRKKLREMVADLEKQALQ